MSYPNRTERINRHHDAAVKHSFIAVEEARAAGLLLLEAKAECRHGEWLNWLAENVTFSQKTAWQYMRIASRWDVIQANYTGGYSLTIRKALRLARYGYSRRNHRTEMNEGRV